MTQNKRIFLNVVATYGRSLYVMVVGLFTARWVLQALGPVDYGLMGLVGGLSMFVTFLNSVLASSVSRFYAVEVGAAKRLCNQDGLKRCLQWFNTAFSLHAIVSIALIVIGYPLGVWTIEHYLSIPINRVVACIWVWRLTCLSCFVAMFSVPFQAMYTAKQEIAELTIYGFFTATCNFCFFYYMVSHPDVWLVKYAAWVCAMSVLPQMIILIRAFFKYKECRFYREYMFDLEKIKDLIKYSGAMFWVEFAGVVGAQGQAILVNKYMGPVYNSSMTVGNGVAGHAFAFSNALSAAFSPAIANKAGEKDYDGMKKFCFQDCRVGAILVVVFALPIILEVKEILRLWLITPPPFSELICMVVLLRMVFEKMTEGHQLAIYGTGTGVRLYCWTVGWAGICTTLVAWFCFSLGLGMWSIVIGLSCSKVITCVCRLWWGWVLLDYSFTIWLKKVFIPIMGTGSLAFLSGLFVVLIMEPSLLRVACTSVVCVCMFLTLCWLCMFEPDEKEIIIKATYKVRERMFGFAYCKDERR